MKENEYKNYLSAVRFAKAKQCGRLGNYLTSGGKIFAHSGFKRGIRIHNFVQEYVEKGTTDWIHPVLNLLPPSEDFVNAETEYSSYTSSSLRYIGSPDLVYKDQVIELKTGKKENWHIDQLRFYLKLTNINFGKIIYIDSLEVVEVDDPVEEKELHEVWDSISKGNPKRCNLCSGCPIKKSCSEWQGEVTSDIIDLVDTVARLRELREEKQSLKATYIDKLDEEIKEILEKERELRDKIAQEQEVNNYSIGDINVQVINSTETYVPENVIEDITYEKNPDLFKEPIIKMSEVKKKFGQKRNKKIVKVSM